VHVQVLLRLLSETRVSRKYEAGLQLMLRHAKRRADAEAVEALLWSIWGAHPGQSVSQ
jgi:L-alanine-DL-glutamate epimerase-like enolase superfamily enzyme